MLSVLFYFVLIVLASLIPEGRGKILPQLWLCYGLSIFQCLPRRQIIFSFHIFFCLQQLNLKVIAYKKEGRLLEYLKAKLTLENKNSDCLFNELKSRDVFDFFDHARWMSWEAHLNSTKMACLVKLKTLRWSKALKFLVRNLLVRHSEQHNALNRVICGKTWFFFTIWLQSWSTCWLIFEKT